jgi:hypothetical protein
MNCEENPIDLKQELDKFVKHQLKCRYYLRYCDDFVLLSKDRNRLLRWKAEIEAFLADRLRLRLNEKRQSLQPVSNGINFLGYIVRHNYVLVRRRVVNNLKARLEGFEKKLIMKDGCSYTKVVYDFEALEKLRAAQASYFGHLKWADAYRLQMSLIKKYGYLRWFFSLKNRKVISTYRTPDKISSLMLQYRYFKTKFPDDILFFQVGRYFDFFEGDRQTAMMLGLRELKKPPCRGVKCGFPVRLKKAFTDKIKHYGKSLTVIKEADTYLAGVKKRLPSYRLVFQNQPAAVN